VHSLLSQHWHHVSAYEALQLLDSDAAAGLDVFEVRRRQARYGPNLLPTGSGAAARYSPSVFLPGVANPLFYALLAALAALVVLGEFGAVAIGVFSLAASLAVGALQDRRPSQPAAAARRLASAAAVLRAGQTVRVPALDLVPGDIVLLREGDRVPADLRLLRAKDLQVEQGALTGDRRPVAKQADVTLRRDTPPAERRNVLYAESIVVRGTATGVVMAIGEDTAVGRLWTLALATPDQRTPFAERGAALSRWLSWLIVLTTILALGAEFLRQPLSAVTLDVPLLAGVRAAATLALSVILTALPIALTLALSAGAARMARRDVVVRRREVLEYLGGISVLCVDQTGILTQDEMTVRAVAVSGEAYEVTGLGYEPEGDILFDGALVRVREERALAECLTGGVLCNDSALIGLDGEWEAHGDPCEVALLVAAAKAGIQAVPLRQEFPLLAELAYSPTRGYMATLHDQGPDRPRLVYARGEPQEVLPLCRSALGAHGGSEPLDIEAIARQADLFAIQGLEVVAIAGGELPRGADTLDEEDLAGALQFLGLQALADPPRPEAVLEIERCRRAGIDVKMLSDDSPRAAAALAETLGIGEREAVWRVPADAEALEVARAVEGSPDADPAGPAFPASGRPTVLTGAAMAAYTDELLIDEVGHVRVWAGLSPAQRLRLVEAIQAGGHAAAITGHDIADAPALREAAAGFAVGRESRGEANALAVLAADLSTGHRGLRAIVDALEEGRRTLDNVTRLMVWALPMHVAEALALVAGVLVGGALPFTPASVLWVNAVIALALGVPLAEEALEPGAMERPPREPRAPLLTRPLLWRVLIVGGVEFVAVLGVFEWELARGATAAQAQTAAANAIVAAQWLHVWAVRSLVAPFWRVRPAGNPMLLAGLALAAILQALYTYAPGMHRLVGSAPLGAGSWARILLAAVLVLGAAEAIKARSAPDGKEAAGR
jgi:cation-transporting ATPase F